MVMPMGELKIKVIRGMNLVVMDLTSSDPYVVVSIGTQEVKTKFVYDNCNPYWNDEVSLGVYDLETPIILTVYDKDLFTADDFMGEARIDIKPYIEYVKAGLDPLPNGSVVDKVDPTGENCLYDTSYIVWKDGKLMQDMILRLNKVISGDVEIRIEWVDVPGDRGLTS